MLNKFLKNNKSLFVAIFLLFFVALVSSGWIIQQNWQLPFAKLFSSSDDLSLQDMAMQLKLLPTMLVSILAGGLFGLSSILLQQLVKNNLASDTTLSVSSGSQLALLLVTLFFPNFGLYGSFWVAFIGAMVSMGLVFLLAKKSGMNPVVLVLAGLIVNILWTALAGVLLLFYSDLTLGVMAWGSGILTQASWTATQQLSIMSIVLAVVLAVIYKPLLLMSLDDRQAKSLGVPVEKIRILVIFLVAMAIAVTVSHLGYIGFVGLASATLVNALAVHSLFGRLLLSFTLGGLLLWLTSNLSVILSMTTNLNIPAGSMTALMGTPLIIWLIVKNKQKSTDESHHDMKVGKKNVSLVGFALALLGLFVVSLAFAPQVSQVGNVADIHFGFVDTQKMALVWDFRLPRTLGAMAIGAMLAIAGVLLQTLSRNPMASPEVLGVGSGVALGVVLAFMLLPMVAITPTIWHLAGFGVLGAVAVLAVVLWLSQKVSSSHLLLVGVAISALMAGVLQLIKLIGDPRLQAVLSFLSGSTANLNQSMSIFLTVIAIIGLMVSLALVKPLTLMSLGKTIAVGRGVAFYQVQLLVLSLIAVFSVASTLAVGPLSFIGLMTPHLATSLGATDLRKKLPLSAMLGAVLMLVADWVGRYLMFPYEIPAGTISAVIGASYFMYLMKNMKA